MSFRTTNTDTMATEIEDEQQYYTQTHVKKNTPRISFYTVWQH
jgi:hypothetical protein